jgi:hypothetical protein
VYIQVASTLVKDALTDEDKILMWHDPITKKEVRAPEDARTIAPKNKIWQAWEGKLDLSLLYLTTAGILVSLKDRSGTYKLTPKGEAMRTELLAQSFYTSIKKGGTK